MEIDQDVDDGVHFAVQEGGKGNPEQGVVFQEEQQDGENHRSGKPQQNRFVLLLIFRENLFVLRGGNEK